MILTALHLLIRMMLAGTILYAWGCASGPELDVMLGESPRASVYLERIADRSFQAAHPIKLDQETVARVLRGITVHEDQGLLRSLVSGQPATLSLFTEDDVRDLSPLITEGLSRAAADQQIGFRVTHMGATDVAHSVGAQVGSSEPSIGRAAQETSRGSLYAYGRSLYVTVLAYRVRPERPDAINMANRRVPDPTGLLNRTLSFSPESAKRPESYRIKSSPDNTLVIDYELLATLPALPAASPATTVIPTPTRPAGRLSELSPETDTRLEALQEQMRQKNVELEELRKELQEIRRQLTKPPATNGSSPNKSNSKTKPAPDSNTNSP